jgi:tripartite-type tricarboxylate transporter receptor subunit TctC
MSLVCALPCIPTIEFLSASFNSIENPMNINFPKFKIAVLGVAASFCLSVFGQAYPSRPVKIIVPFAAGGPADNFARFMGQRLSDALGQPFVVDNRPGGGSVIGTDVAAKAAPDGYTLLMMSNTHTVNETLLANKPFALMRDFVAVAPINYSDLVLVAHPSVKANNLKELLALAKAQPGKINYASSGPGTPYHMAGELLKSMAGVYLVHIPYKGSSGARTDVIGGQVELMFDAVTTMTEQVKAGKVKAIATSGKVRSDVLPDVPTLAEAGVPGYEATIWLGLMAPKGTPKAVVDKLNEAVSKIASQPDVKALWTKQGAVPMVMTPEAFDKYARDDIAKWADVIKKAGIKAD